MIAPKNSGMGWAVGWADRRGSRLAGFVAGIALGLAAVLHSGTAQAASLIRDTEIEKVLRHYGDPIFVAAGLDPKAVSIYIINDPSINAFVSGGQNMFIYTGLIMKLETPNQLIGVMAHEAGHIAGGHLSRTSDAIAEASIPVIVTILAGIAAVALGAPDAGIGLILGSQQIAQRSFLQYSRTQESAADQAGMTILTATGQSGRGMLDVFEKFAEQELLTFRRQDPYVRSHPLSRERIATLRERVEASPFADAVTPPEMQVEYDLIRAKLRGFVDRPDVTLRNYPLSDQSAPARYARAVAYFRWPQFDKSVAEIDSLLAEFPDNPYFHELKGQIEMERSNPKGAIAPYEESIRLEPDAPLLRVNLASALLATENESYTERARVELVSSLRDDNENAFAWYQLALAYSRLGDQGMADLASAERDFVLGNLPGALQFAIRAKQRLPQGTTYMQRCDDIIAIAGDAVERERR